MLQSKEKTAIPKYQQIAGALRKSISKGQLKSGEQLLPIRELAKYHGTTTMTVRKVFDLLEKENLIEKVDRKGIFVKKLRPITIGLTFDRQIFDDTATAHLPHLVSELGRHFTDRKWNYRCFLHLTDDLDQVHMEFMQAIKERWFDCLLVCSQFVGQETIINQLHERDIHCVGMYPFSAAIKNWVAYSGLDTGKAGADALIKKGCRRLAIISGPTEYPELGNPLKGFVHALNHAGLVAEQGRIRTIPFTEQEGMRCFQELWTKHGDFDGLIVTDELIFRGVVKGIHACGIKVPQQLKVATQMSTNDKPLFFPVVKLLTPPAQEAACIVEMFEQLINDNTVENPHTILNVIVEDCSE